MSMSPNNTERATPAKTPGWGKGLFGMFSAKKTGPVDDGTNATGPSPSPHRRDVVDLALPTESSNVVSSPTRAETAAALNAANSNNDSSGFFSPQGAATTNTVATMPMKSPWKNPSFNGDVVFAPGNLKPATNGTLVNERGLQSNGNRNRRKRYIPSRFLAKSKSRKYDAKTASLALRQSKNLFKPTKKQESELRNYDLILQPGKRILGEYQQGSRLPQQTEKVGEKHAVEAPEAQPQAKRQKKVKFDNMDTDAPKDSSALPFATPAKKSLPRKSTPFKVMDLKPPAPTTPGASTPTTPVMASPQTSKLAPKPVIAHLVEAPFSDWESAEEAIPLGAPITTSTMRFQHDLGARKKSPENSMSQLVPFKGFVPKKKEPKTKGPKAQMFTTDDEFVDAEPQTKKTKTLAEQFGGMNKNKWKCEKCYVQNDNSLYECSSCEFVRPGYEKQHAEKKAKKDKKPSASIGAGGFSFGGAPATKSGVGKSSAPASQFSFGAAFGGAAPTPAASGATGG
ncbi:MAG: hypothetical protein SGBAC_002461, partial [Bacillariaceae sp.]